MTFLCLLGFPDYPTVTMVHILFIIEFCLENLKLALLFQRFF